MRGRSAAARESAYLVYVDYTPPSMTPQRAGREFFYRSPDGERIVTSDEIGRLKGLVISPACDHV